MVHAGSLGYSTCETNCWGSCKRTGMLYSFLEGIMWSNHLLLTSPYFVFQHSNWEWYMVLGCSDWSSEGACWYILPGCSSRWHWVILYLASQHVSMRNILFPEWSLISWMLLEFWTLWNFMVDE